MERYKISKGKARDLQEWALKQSGAFKYLGSLRKFPQISKVKPGLYVDYEIDEDELDGGIDWPDIGIATIYAVLEEGEEELYLGEVRAYNFETFWLSTRECDEVDSAKDWFDLIKEDYERLAEAEKNKKKEESFKINFEEAEALYNIIKEYEKDAPESDKKYYDDYYDEYKTPIKKKVRKSLLKKIGDLLPEEQKTEIDKDFLREKYHTFNNEIDERVYAVIEKALSKLKTAEIKYFNMESADFSKRKIDVYYKSRRYTIGYCHLKNGIRKFRTSRIASAKLTNDTYQIPKDFDKSKY